MTHGHVPHLDKPVSRLVLGADHFSEAEENAAVRLLDAFVELGGNCVDMAHVYGGGQGQRIVGRWMKARGNRDQMVLLDKGCHPSDRPRLTVADLDSDLFENLSRLQVEHVDLFVFHRDDPTQPVGPLIERLNDHVREGRIGAFGGSNWTAARVREANAYAEDHGLQPFSLSNPNFSLATVNEPMWPGCVTLSESDRAWHVATQFPLFSWSSQGGGYFAGRTGSEVERVYDNAVNRARRKRARRLADEAGVSPVTVALAWVLCQPFPVWALVGPRTVAELMDSVRALDLRLSPDELRWLEWGAPESEPVADESASG